MLANRVRETTTTTGTGNLTLAGAATNRRSFSSQFATSQRFNYFIDDESGNFENGIGYLSDSTTLVRETVLDSSNAGALVSFGAGTKQVFCTQSAGAAYSSSGFILDLNAGLSDGLTLSGHVVYEGTNMGLQADRVYYLPFLANHNSVSRLAVGCANSVDSGSKFRLGFCPMHPVTRLPQPDLMLAETADLTPIVDTQITGTVASFNAIPGLWYYFIIVTNAVNRVACSSNAAGRFLPTPLGVTAQAYPTPIVYLYEDVSPGWSTLPTSISAINYKDNDYVPYAKVGQP